MNTHQDRPVEHKTSSAGASRCACKDHFSSWMLHTCSGEDHPEKLECFWTPTRPSAGIRSVQSLSVYTWLPTRPLPGASLQWCCMFFAKLRCETFTDFLLSHLTNKYSKVLLSIYSRFPLILIQGVLKQEVFTSRKPFLSPNQQHQTVLWPRH